MSTGKPHIGFIGLGNMGGHMANNLLKAEYPLTVFDLSDDAVNRLCANGAKKASIQDIGANCDVVITMLPSSPHVRSVYCDDGGLLKAAKANTLFIDSSTIDPTTARDVAKEAVAAGSSMVDAPVSGGVGGAEAGTLTFMVGGPESAFDCAQHVLKSMGKNIVHCGDSGTGQVAKVCNNLILGISMVAVSEGMNLGVKLGMDPKVLAGIVNTSSGRCWSSDTYNPCPGVLENVPSSKGYAGGFGVDLMKKDLSLALMAGSDSNAQLPLGFLTHAIYEKISQAGNGKKDFGVVFDCLNKNQLK